MRLLNRTSRSVTLTAAGEELRAAISGHFDAIGTAVDVLNRYRRRPGRSYPANVLEHAATMLLAPALPSFIERYPHIEVDVVVSNDMVDVVEAGADAGIRYGGTVPEDMVAQRLSPDMRWVATSAPSYFERFGTPLHPNDLCRTIASASAWAMKPVRLGIRSRRRERSRRRARRDHHRQQRAGTGSRPVAAAAIAYLPEPLALPYAERGTCG